MWPESAESKTRLRTGLTTGTCATACCVAAASYLLNGQKPDTVTVTLPRGKQVELKIKNYRLDKDGVRASTIKDAGDDPDVTHGAIVFVELRKADISNIEFHAGEGVGIVTREGLGLLVGGPAINPVPRKMMIDHLQSMAKTWGYPGGFEVTVGVESGEAIAQKTMNPRLGIIGGLSILGTSGIVRPYSCAAWIASIHQGIDVANANGIGHIAASTGNTSEAAIKAHYQLDDIALIEMGDFAGAVLKHLKKVPVPKLSICGGIGKISKLANGHMDLNSRVSSIDFEQLADIATSQGGGLELQQAITSANTSVEAVDLCQQQGIDISHILCDQALIRAQAIVPDSVNVEIWAIDRRGNFLGHAGQF